MKKKRLLAKIVTLAMAVQCIGTTSLISFAEEDVNITADETVLTSESSDEYISYFDAVVSVAFQGTGEYLDGVDVKFVEYSEDTSDNPDAEVIAVLDSWNTSYSNPHTIENIGFTKGHFYCAEIEQIPDGYAFGNETSFSTGYHGNGIMSGTRTYDINLNNRPTFVKPDYPFESSWNATFSVRDIVDEELFSGLDVELVSMDSDYNVQEVLAEWNTSENEVYSIELPCYFEHENDNSYYGVKIKNLPEGYVYHDTDIQNGYSVFSYSTLTWYIERLYPEIYHGMHDVIVYLQEENAVIDDTARPNMTNTTTSPHGNTHVTTTTTTAIPADKGTVWGDANEDGEVTLADAVLIMQSLSNPNDYSLSETGKLNADVSNHGDGVTASDALVIQQVNIGLVDIKNLPLYAE